ncbi:organic hydroperoxide resistance protein [Nocardia vermiculata]|uniref:Organic hydroperoxide resistance protein n=1 Tax=Nocardia vermiculata TaxID=257274 RepID=A0A846Y1Y6_9NOCA|nr:organic hydroperoxide resistance protein [Nocardia vermiculata]NKY52195.1 organic hydroperoxide resistance protein [Nocardia vermiculata]
MSEVVRKKRPSRNAAQAIASGDGRNGIVRTPDGNLDITLAVPEPMGGTGQGTNPEQLFAAGYSACFHSAVRTLAKEHGADTADSAVAAEVGIGADGAGGYLLEVVLEVSLPRVDATLARTLADSAHEVCPYSRATRGNIEVDIRIAED